MKNALGILLVLASTCAPAFSQQQLNAATREDVEQLLTLTGARDRIQQMWAAMAQQAAITAADSYQHKHPDATPLELREVAEATGQSMQASLKAFPVEELIDAIVPIYQRHFTHADVVTVIEFYSSPTGQKYLKELPAMLSESMQSMQPIIKKHEPEMEAAAEKAAEDVAKTDAASPKAAGERQD